MKSKNLLIVLLLIPNFGYSQKVNFSIGVEAGVNVSRINGIKRFVNVATSAEPSEAEFLTRTGQVGGLFGQIHFNKYLALQTGFYYEDKGDDYRYFMPHDPWVNIEYSNQYYYNSYHIRTRVLPLLLKGQYGGDRLKGFVSLGGYAAYIKNFYSFQTDPKTIFKSDFMLEDALFKRFEYGLSAGVGVSYTLKEKVSFSFEVRTNQGVNDILDEFHSPDSKHFKLSTLNFLFGVTHHLTTSPKTNITE